MNPFKQKIQNFFKCVEKCLFHHRKYLFATAINLTVLFILSLALQLTDLIDVQRHISLELFAWTVIAFDIVVLRVHQHTTKKDLFKYIFLTLLIIFFINEYYPLEILNTLNTPLFIITLIFGAITFYDNRQVIDEIDKENEKEQLEEQKRQKEFAHKFPKINKTPILSTITRWIYKEGWIYSVSFLLIVLIAAGLRLHGISDYDLRGDEFLAVGAANGYLNTGAFYRWDWIKNEPICMDLNYTCTYNRAWPHSLLIAQSYKLYGVSEWSSRIVSVLFGVILVIVSYFIAKDLFKDKKLALLFIITITFSPSFIDLSRFVRMYALFIPVYLISIYFIFKGLTGSNSINIKNRFINGFVKKYDYNYVYLLSGLMFLYVSYLLHISTLVIFLPLFLFVLVLSIKEGKPKYIIPTILALWALVSISVLYFIFNMDIVHSHFITILDKPKIIYWNYLLGYPFFQSFGTLLLILTVVLLFVSYSRKNELIYLLFIIFVSGAFFVYCGNRYASFVYTSNLVPISILVMLYSFYSIVRIFKLKVLKLLIISILLFSVMFHFDNSTDTLYDSSYSRLSKAYKTIVDNYNPETEIIMGQYLRGYYLKDLKGNVTVVGMSHHKRYTYDQFQRDLGKSGGGWITWELGKSYHIREDIRQYIDKHFIKYHGRGIDNTNVEVYYVNKSMITDTP